MSIPSGTSPSVASLTGRLLLDGAFVPGRVSFAGGRIVALERSPSVPDDAPL